MSQSSSAGGSCVGLLADAVRRVIRIVPHANELDRSDVAALDHLGDLHEVRRRAVLRTDLHDAIVLARRVHHHAAFANGQRDGLLDVHVLAGLTRQHRGDRVPVIRRRDMDCIHILQIEQLSENPGETSRRGRPIREPVRHSSCKRRRPPYRRRSELRGSARNIAAASTASDQTDVHAIVGAENPRGGEGCHSHSRRRDETASIHAGILCHLRPLTCKPSPAIDALLGGSWILPQKSISGIVNPIDTSWSYFRVDVS